jgi:hypothetical protein
MVAAYMCRCNMGRVSARQERGVVARRAGLLRTIAASGFALGVVPAWADVTFAYTGFVVAGYDETGIFGTPGASLTGDSFTLTYTSNGQQIVPTNGFSYESV